MTFEQLKKVNQDIKTKNIKGKEYAEVNERIIAFRKLYPDGFITTQIIKYDDGFVLIGASVGYYDEEDGSQHVLGTGMAYEREGASQINKTSYIENCETSAVGRALGMAGFGIGASIASAEEVAQAIHQQETPVKYICTVCGGEADEQYAKATKAKFKKIVCKACCDKKTAEAKAKKAAEEAQRAEIEAANADLPFPI